MGVADSVVIVEGYSDAKFYRKLADRDVQIMPLNELYRAEYVENNREELVSLASEMAQHNFIVDDDMMSIVEDGLQESLPRNLATTWVMNDIECWSFHVLDQADMLDKIGIIRDDVEFSLRMAKELGILLFIQRERGGNRTSRWKLNLKAVLDRIIADQLEIISSSDLRSVIFSRLRRTDISEERWIKKMDKLRNALENKERLAAIRGHDLIFFLCYSRCRRENTIFSKSILREFEGRVRNAAASLDGAWGDLLNGKIGLFLSREKAH